MKALNKQERNSAILKFSLWLLISVLIICVPICITAFMPVEQENLEEQETEELVEEVNFEKDYFAVKINEINELMNRKEAGEVDIDSFNAELKNHLTDMTKQTENDLTWRGDMFRNVIAAYDYLIVANRIVTSSGDKTEDQLAGVSEVIIELDAVIEDLADLSDQKKKKDIYEGLDEIQEQLAKVQKMLINYKATLK